MGSFCRVKPAAFAAILWLLTLANAQGFFYDDFTQVCSSQQDFQYLGCFATTNQPWTYNPTNRGGDPSRSWVHWDQGDNVNITTTPYFCTDTCRAHGFKYAATWDRQCRCGMALQSSVKDLGSAQPDDSLCTDAGSFCPGDRRENCGTNQGARIWVDPSFQEESLLPDPSILAAQYNVLGCFYQPNLPSGDASVTTTTQSSTTTCFTYCADLGYPLTFMVPLGSGSVKCSCGQDFGVESRSYLDVSNQYCSTACDTGLAGGCTGLNCCGNDGAQVYPVYANPNLLGCHVPRIPGYADQAVATPAADSYTCIETPASILTRPPYTIAYDAAATISRSATFVATAQAEATPYVNYGCYSDLTLAGALGGIQAIATNLLAGGVVTVQTCTEYCDANDYPYAGLTSTNVGTSACFCGTGPGAQLNSSNVQAMEDCNYPCSGSPQENCGSPNGPLLYVASDIVVGGAWAASYTATYSSTPIYSCTETRTTTSSTSTSTITSSSSTITSSSSTETSSSSTDTSSPTTITSSSSTDTSSASAATSTITPTIDATTTVITTSSETGTASTTTTGTSVETTDTSTTTDISSTATTGTSSIVTTDTSGSTTEVSSTTTTDTSSSSIETSSSETTSTSSMILSTSTSTATTTETSSTQTTDTSSEIISTSSTSTETASTGSTDTSTSGTTSSQTTDISFAVTSTDILSNTLITITTDTSSSTTGTTSIQTSGTSSGTASTDSTDSSFVMTLTDRFSTESVTFTLLTTTNPDSSTSKTDATSSGTTEASLTTTNTDTASTTISVPSSISTTASLPTTVISLSILPIDESITLLPTDSGISDTLLPTGTDSAGTIVPTVINATTLLSTTETATLPTSKQTTGTTQNTDTANTGTQSSGTAHDTNTASTRTETSGTALNTGTSNTGTQTDGNTSTIRSLVNTPTASFANTTIATSSESSAPATSTSGTGTAGGSLTAGSSSISLSTIGTSTIISSVIGLSTASPFMISSSTTSSAGNPGVTNMPEDEIILAILPVDDGPLVNLTRRGLGDLAKRQATDGGFVGGAAPTNPDSCNDATPFNLTNGRLGSGGQFVATNPGIAYKEFKVSPTGSISTTFTVSNGVLAWYNDVFYGGQAGFCQVPSGQIFITFGIPGTEPVDCEFVFLVVYERGQCNPDGAIISITSPISSTSTAASAGTATTISLGTLTTTATPSGSGGDGNGLASATILPQSQDIFPFSASPADEICVETTLSWYPGQPTFLPAV
ncbi:putative WSC domain-containing protein [Seiridium cardinale]